MKRGVPWARGLFAASVAGALAVLAATLAGRAVPPWMPALAALGLFASVGAGVFLMGSGLFARPLLGVDPAQSAGRLALTFDDGPDSAHTRAVMDALEARGHRGTFFVIGRRAAAAPELLAEIVRRGHALGNHTWHHAWRTPALPVRVLADDLTRAQALLAQAGSTSRWFRPPIGILSPRVALAARAANLDLVGWTATARDGVRTGVERATARLARAARPGAILVLHDAAEREGRAPIAAEVVRRLADLLDARGLKSVTLDELVRVVRP